MAKPVSYRNLDISRREEIQPPPQPEPAVQPPRANAPAAGEGRTRAGTGGTAPRTGAGLHGLCESGGRQNDR